MRAIPFALSVLTVPSALEGLAARNVPGDVEFSFAASVVHVSHLAEYGAHRAPRPVVNAHDTPRDADEAVRAPPVERVFVVQGDAELERLLGALCPLEDLLGPVHPHVSVHLPTDGHLPLRGIPQLVVRLAPLELFQRVQVRARVASVLVDGGLRPVLGAFHAVVARLVPHEVVSELAPYYELLVERVHCVLEASAVLARVERCALRAEVAEA
mmetsp:Transcript_2744/g.11000  ORF Transcript_2744/g.11000 Transcript_2744/m.11000 type:complete len:213 (+) Transcript_2744:2112-2750(+)